MFFFSPIINKKSWHANFLIKRFNAPSFFACVQVMLKKKSIWHSLTWIFHCGNFLNHSKTLLHMCNWYILINVNLIDAKQMLWHWERTCALFVNLMILCNFISVLAFTVDIEKWLQFEISLWFHWPKWNLHRSEFHFTWNHLNADNEVTLHQIETLPQSEISNRFEFTSGLM